MHKFAVSPAWPGRIFLQHHGGVYRSDDGGSTWTNISAGLPSDFGFPVVAHPRNPDCCYVVPLEADEKRWPPGGRLAVYRTTDAGKTWQALGRGLPDKDAYMVVLRDGLASDDLAPAGLYMGTTGGDVYASADEGETWQTLASHLPSVLGVSARVVG